MVSPKETTESINDSSIKIDNADIADIPSIMEIQKSQIKVPEDLSEEDAGHGFLVYEVKLDELKKIMTSDIKHIIKVVRKNGVVIGYFIAYDMRYYLQQHPKWIDEFEDNSGRGLKRIFIGDNVLFSKQIALSTAVKGSGLGAKLYEAVYQDAIFLGFKHEVGEVLAAPVRNSAMETLVFSKLHFKLAGYRTDRNKRKWSVITRTFKSH